MIEFFCFLSRIPFTNMPNEEDDDDDLFNIDLDSNFNTNKIQSKNTNDDDIFKKPYLIELNNSKSATDSIQLNTKTLKNITDEEKIILSQIFQENTEEDEEDEFIKSQTFFASTQNTLTNSEVNHLALVIQHSPIKMTKVFNF